MVTFTFVPLRQMSTNKLTTFVCNIWEWSYWWNLPYLWYKHEARSLKSNQWLTQMKHLNGTFSAHKTVHSCDWKVGRWPRKTICDHSSLLYISPAFSMDVCFDLVTLKLFMWKNFELLFIIILAKTMWFLSHRVKYWPLDDQPNHKGISWNHILGKPLPCLLPLSPSLLLLRENVSYSCGIPYV